MHNKLDGIPEEFNGLREYLYEIDPQFNDERRTRTAGMEDEYPFAGKDHLDLLYRKSKEGKRTLDTPFSESQ
ncbi:MAG: hypothetical protein ACREPH_13440 [Rhodanobacteraceae bacterium]